MCRCHGHGTALSVLMCGHHCGIQCTAVCYCTAGDPAQAGYINVDSPTAHVLFDSRKWKLMQMSLLLDAISSRMF